MSLTVNNSGVLHEITTLTANNAGVLRELTLLHANDSGVLRPIFGVWKAPETLNWLDRLQSNLSSLISSFSVSDNGYKCSLYTHNLPSSSPGYTVYVEFILPKTRKTKFSITTQNYTAYHVAQASGDTNRFHGIDYIKEQSSGDYLYNPSTLYLAKSTVELVLSGGYHKLEIHCGYTASLGISTKQTFVIALSEQK